MTSLPPGLALVLLLLSAMPLRAAWMDFDARGGRGDWNAPSGGATLAWEAAAPGEPVTGAVLRIKGPQGGFAYTRRDLLPADLPSCESVVFRVRRVAPEAAESAPAIEVQLIEPDGKSKFWRKVELASTNWTEVRLPLRFFRTGGTRLPRWDGLRFFAFYLRTPAEFLVSGLDFAKGAGGDVRILPKELRQIAFPDAPEGAVRLAQKPGIVLLTDCARLDVKQLAERLDGLSGDLQTAFPFAPPAAEPPSLVVFDRRADYEEFPGRIAQRMDSAADRPQSGGYTILSISTSYFDEQYGTLRPVYFHEFTHAWLGRRLRMEDDGGWFQEGFANYFQLKLFPQANIAGIVRQGLDDASYRMPLKELCSGKRIPMDRYWQAMTVAGMLLAKDPYRGKLEAMVTAFHSAGSIDLAPVLGPVFGKDWDAFTADWTAYARSLCGQP